MYKMNEFVDRSMGFDLVKKSERPCDYSTIDHTETKTEPEFCLYSLYDENTKTFIRKNSWLGFATGPIKIFGSIKKAGLFPAFFFKFCYDIFVSCSNFCWTTLFFVFR